ncbi:MAG: nucleotidyltransferase family protein [bacterium]|nr:nucleotidyltransferase family protein [bacterium]
MNVCALLLAAGESKRFGSNKLLLPLHTRAKQHSKEKLCSNQTLTIINHILHSIIQSGLTKVITVLGYQASQLKQQILSEKYYYKEQTIYPIFVINSRYRLGIASSIISGIGKLPQNTHAVFIFLADKPLISIKTIQKMIDQTNKTNKGIIIPVYQGIQGHPVVFKKKYFTALRHLDKNKDFGARELITAHLDDVEYVMVKDIGVIHDIDTISDYIQVRKRSQKLAGRKSTC